MSKDKELDAFLSKVDEIGISFLVEYSVVPSSKFSHLEDVIF